MAKDQNSYLKRQREMKKKRKAEDKRARRQAKKEQTDDKVEAEVVDRPADDQ